jgi:Protein of unknown function (DUF4199)
MKKFTPLAKGLFTATTILGLTLFIYYFKLPPDTKLNYLMYILYAAGIIWTLIEYHRFVNNLAKFGELFGQGFRCFIVVTLIMVVFKGIFIAAHPEFAEQDAKLYKEYLDKEIKDKTPAEKDEMVAMEKKQYTTKLIYSDIFGYLIVGSIITAAGSGIILLRRK